MSKSLSGKVIVITGASSGIGQTMAEFTASEPGRATHSHNRLTRVKLFASEGAKVCIAARREAKLQEVKDRIEAASGTCAIQVCDVVQRSQVAALITFAEKELGPVDVLVNNAGVMPLSFMRNLHQDEWDTMIDVNIKGVLNGIGAVLPGMLERNRGDIVNISSDAGRKIFPAGAVYSATKWAVEAITQGLRQETKGTNLRILSVQPGATASELGNSITDKEVFDMFAKEPLERFLDAADVARAVLYALQQPQHCSVNEVLVRATCQRQ